MLQVFRSSLPALTRLVLGICLVLVIVAAFWPAPVLAASQTIECDRNYVVKKDETLKEIGQRFGLKWKDIARANGMTKPTDVVAGNKICIPTSGTASAEKDRNYSVKMSVSGGRIYLITDGFKSDYKFFIKVRDGSAATALWYKLEDIRVEKNTRQSFSFLVPAELKKVVQLTICMKNSSTNSLTCQTAVNKP